MKTIKLQLDLTKFITTGKFDFVELGMSKEELNHQFFSPEDWLANETPESSRIWRYGNFELHFDDSSTISGIFNDYITNFDGGDSIEITDNWIIKKGNEAPTLEKVIQALNSLMVDFEKTTNNIDIITLSLSNGIHLYFDNGDLDIKNHNHYLWSAMEKKA